MNHDCPFCSPSIEDHVFMETTDMLAVYNISPILPGHSMVIPRRHVESVNDLSDNELDLLFRFARKVTKLLVSFFKAEGFDWSLQESEAAGQSIYHVHLHIIPRKTGDLEQPGDWYSRLQESKKELIDNSLRRKLSKKEISEIVTSLKTFIA
ncbi:MAG: HIT family protein [Bacteroidales bacterium]